MSVAGEMEPKIYYQIIYWNHLYGCTNPVFFNTGKVTSALELLLKNPFVTLD